eukprot:890030-Amphidinium_carterae.1
MLQLHCVLILAPMVGSMGSWPLVLKRFDVPCARSESLTPPHRTTPAHGKRHTHICWRRCNLELNRKAFTVDCYFAIGG